MALVVAPILTAAEVCCRNQSPMSVANYVELLGARRASNVCDYVGYADDAGVAATSETKSL
jgi:hypothetical protein